MSEQSASRSISALKEACWAQVKPTVCQEALTLIVQVTSISTVVLARGSSVQHLSEELRTRREFSSHLAVEAVGCVWNQHTGDKSLDAGQPVWSKLSHLCKEDNTYLPRTIVKFQYMRYCKCFEIP